LGNSFKLTLVVKLAFEKWLTIWSFCRNLQSIDVVRVVHWNVAISFRTIRP